MTALSIYLKPSSRSPQRVSILSIISSCTPAFSHPNTSIRRLSCRRYLPRRAAPRATVFQSVPDQSDAFPDTSSAYLLSLATELFRVFPRLMDFSPPADGLEARDLPPLPRRSPVRLPAYRNRAFPRHSVRIQPAFSRQHKTIQRQLFFLSEQKSSETFQSCCVYLPTAFFRRYTSF